MLRNYNKRFYYKLCYYYYYVYVNPRFQGGNPRFSNPRFHVGNPRLNQPQILRWQPQIVQPQIFHCQPQTQKIFRASRGSGVTQIIQYAPVTLRPNLSFTSIIHTNLYWPLDRKSTRLNSSHRCISYAVFCLKKKKN